MKEALLIFALAVIFVTSCTKPEPPKAAAAPKSITTPTREDTCLGKFFFGWYSIKTTSAHLFLDSLMFVRSDNVMRMECLQLTRINDTPTYYFAKVACDSAWIFRDTSVGIEHFVRFAADGALIDSLVVDSVARGVNRYGRYM